MFDEYLMIRKSVLPDYFEKVLAARRLLETGKAKDVSQAARRAGISRSTYYKYKDCILDPALLPGGRKAVLSMMLAHEPGVLSALLSCLSAAGGSILTITQSLPIHDRASVTLSLDVSAVAISMAELLAAVERVPGVEHPRLLALE